MTLGIVTDSTSDLPAALAGQYGIEVVPAVLVIDGQGYLDGQGITREAFYSRLPGMTSPPTTASPSVGDFAARYRALFEQGCDHILSIHAAGTLTTILNAARLAAAEFEDRVSILDSGQLTLGLGFQALAAAEAAGQGATPDEAREAVRSVRGRVRVMAALDTLEYVRRSGRIPATVAALGGMLSIKPLVELREGVVRPVGAVRTTHQADARMLELLRDLGPLQRLALLHTNAESRARWLLGELMRTGSPGVPRDILLINVTTVIGTHVGPHGLGFAAVPM